jgi:hypothetical protein
MRSEKSVFDFAKIDDGLRVRHELHQSMHGNFLAPLGRHIRPFVVIAGGGATICFSSAIHVEEETMRVKYVPEIMLSKFQKLNDRMRKSSTSQCSWDRRIYPDAVIL